MPSQGKELLSGIAGSKGVYEGVVWVVNSTDPAAFKGFPAGHILVAPKLLPEHKEALEKAAAFIMDTGGKGSHGCTGARARGISCVSGTVLATKTLKTGMKVIVDGTAGKVYEYIESAPTPKPIPQPGQSDFEKAAAKAGMTLNPELLKIMKQLGKK